MRKSKAMGKKSWRKKEFGGSVSVEAALALSIFIFAIDDSLSHDGTAAPGSGSAGIGK